MGIASVSCPTCGADVRVGIPMGAAVVSVTADPPGGESKTEPPVDEDAGVEKHRPAGCPDGHEFGVRFRLGADR